MGVEAFGQCAACRGAVAASQEAAQGSSQWDLAVLVLLIPPVAIFVGIFSAGYRYRNYHGRANRNSLPPETE
jgi:hypothetical protein